MNMTAALDALKKYFGYSSFRPLQDEIIESALQGKDTLVLMPTGGGKSLCFQIPAIIMPGTALVVSPLISLMKDQVDALQANGVAAAYINSSQDRIEHEEVMDALLKGELDMLYVSPEKLASKDFRKLLTNIDLNLLAIDEAHCISSWGHDFRPEYTQLRYLRDNFPDIPIVACTATADKITRRDIVDQLNLDDPRWFIASFDRPNLSLEVRPGQQKIGQVISFIQQRPDQSGIVYCLSRKGCEDTAEKLMKAGISAIFYHAGMSAEDRNMAQNAFINDEATVVCATIAFGMGIDKSNIRWIIHFNLPKNIENYYQEIGRAGRDGVAADTLLFYSFRDVMVLRGFVDDPENPLREVQVAKLERMQQFAESLICRRRMLLAYFGEDYEPPCGNCDVCKNPPQSYDGTVLAQKALSAIYRLGQQQPMGVVIDVLRGSAQRYILEQGLDNIKTYGAGRDMSTGGWLFVMQQLLQMGYMEIAYDQKHAVRLNDASERVLFSNEKVQLVRSATIKERQASDKSRLKKRSAMTDGGLMKRLRRMRAQLARKRGVPPYIIFSDATLQEITQKRPVTDDELREINGVGERKLFLYGEHVQSIVLEYLEQQKPKVSTLEQTRILLKEGNSPEKIAQQRQLSVGTVYSHLIKLLESGDLPNSTAIMTDEECEPIWAAAQNLPEGEFRLKPIHEALGGKVPYEKIRFAVELYKYRQAKKDSLAN